MLAKSKATSFIDNLTIEVMEARKAPLHVVLRSEDGKICCKTEKKMINPCDLIRWEGLNDLPYGVYTLECSQGDDIIELKIVKRI
jgi:hypothetical protein